ncbi:RdgB/HAM1 family non-canonical purine NTP pyrophosphatase [Corynebacterium pelargi]|uniref:dITP/XTP pyrophosphatase n=1 Tax=Corynebacterium pelargi TaxID=1471400 RepID=A0A410W738_9CORY|nr:RdgB/HAM1 family non-canonical purine NTP pyrophosphatase [Corynebacterium pelargi]QAU51792.1 dITP/XTP pyrophosphatase [Corynebacterium pelargi]GGG72427.1 non-canonical purine NTP pyrophosphatase [Corynebacterium pelargi]
MQVLLASNNAKKLRELQAIVDHAGIQGVEVLALSDVPAYEEPVEDGRTFSDNALIKARAGAKHTGLVTVADDSGIAVEELNGMPGVLSARWSGSHGNDQANNELLLGQMAHVPAIRRGAAFISVCALVTPDGTEHVVEGRWPGRLLTAPQGEHGFGYDPLFVPAEEDAAGTKRSAAELSPEEKNAISHRGRALAQLVPIIQSLV